MKKDNIPSSWAKEAVEWAKNNGILLGDTSGNLMLEEPCTRQEMVVFLYRLYSALKE